MTTQKQVTQFIPRWYQDGAINAGVSFFRSDATYNAFIILPTGSGKSVVIANMVKDLNDLTLILQPSKEILTQNVKKYESYGYTAGVYSASAGEKFLGKATFATIGSVVNKPHLFRKFKYIIIDECHLVSSRDGESMYNSFLAAMPQAKVVGLTATPYRLEQTKDGAMLCFLNRTSPRIFTELIYYVQNESLFKEGHLAKLEYYSFNLIDRSKLKVNSSGTDFTEQSLKAYYRSQSIPSKIAHYSNILLTKRKNLLVFASLIEEAYVIQKLVPGSVVIHGESKDRDAILKSFTSGRIKCLINVGVLTTGFDYPELECVLLSKSTMSLSLYYQIFGRGLRPHKSKDTCWLVDLGGNIDKFGKFETMIIKKNKLGLYAIFNNGRQLTDVTLDKAA
jgi:DNA repair protein RadD